MGVSLRPPARFVSAGDSTLCPSGTKVLGRIAHSCLALSAVRVATKSGTRPAGPDRLGTCPRNRRCARVRACSSDTMSTVGVSAQRPARQRRAPSSYDPQEQERRPQWGQPAPKQKASAAQRNGQTSRSSSSPTTTRSWLTKSWHAKPRARSRA